MGRFKNQPTCIMAHDLLNKLTVIIGGCDLLEEKASDSECVRLILAIRDSAKAMADELKQHQCDLDIATQFRVINETESHRHS